MSQLIDAVSQDAPKALSEILTLDRRLKQRAADVVAYFDRLGTSEAINGRLESIQ